MDWEELEKKCKGCTACRLHDTRKNVVIGRGDRNADIMFVGEGPGEAEDNSGLPFVGAAGQLLEKYFTALGIDSEKVYIANIVKCRPPHNRDPEADECDACIGYLREQLKLIKPKVIVCLGRIAAIKIIDPEFRITKEHGNYTVRGAYTLTAVYHPSAVLRDPLKREDMYRDLEKIRNDFYLK